MTIDPNVEVLFISTMKEANNIVQSATSGVSTDGTETLDHVEKASRTAAAMYKASKELGRLEGDVTDKSGEMKDGDEKKLLESLATFLASNRASLRTMAADMFSTLTRELSVGEEG